MTIFPRYPDTSLSFFTPSHLSYAPSPLLSAQLLPVPSPLSGNRQDPGRVVPSGLFAGEGIGRGFMTTRGRSQPRSPGLPDGGGGGSVGCPCAHPILDKMGGSLVSYFPLRWEYQLKSVTSKIPLLKFCS